MARLFRGAYYLQCHLLQLEGWRTGALGSRKSKSDGSDSNDENLSKKELEQITSSFGKGLIMWLGRSPSPSHFPVIPTGSFVLDIALGTGGFPKGHVVEIYSPEASGKQKTLALHVIAEAQKLGGHCVFVDAEHALNPALAEAIGVKTENLLLSQPDCGKQALSLVDTLIRSGSVDVVVVDSVSNVAALVPKGELDGAMGDAHVAMQARLMRGDSQTYYLWWFYATMRLHIRKIGLIKKGEEKINYAPTAGSASSSVVSTRIISSEASLSMASLFDFFSRRDKKRLLKFHHKLLAFDVISIQESLVKLPCHENLDHSNCTWRRP
ncbi:hypothetical protein ACJRO7_013928 [Eucalyptus globulus]|uniref:RecA family profile 1 domain-containing protein n=1 Tax=Eucalyptus globulus TaxID=34317 RepID=A0ABD3KYF9_EUCGL